MDIYHEKMGLLPVRTATFVSLLFNSYAIKAVGLPMREYFIWGDDKEYTSRMSQYFNCYNVVDSEVTHKTDTNVGSNITTDKAERINRYFYAYRNDLATARERGIKELAIYTAGFALNAFRVGAFATDSKRERLNAMINGARRGLTFKPKRRYVISSDK